MWLKTLSKGVKTHLSKSKTFGFWNFFLICYKLLWKSNILNPIFKKFSRGATHPRTPRKWLGPSGLAEVWEKRASWRGAGGKWLTLVSISLRLPYPCTLVQNSFKRRKNTSFKVKNSKLPPPAPRREKWLLRGGEGNDWKSECIPLCFTINYFYWFFGARTFF